MSLPYRLGSTRLFDRTKENPESPKRVVFLSVEGTVTETKYFSFIEQCRRDLGINPIVHVEVLRKYDTNSDPKNVLALLEEYVRFRENKMFETEISSLQIRHYDQNIIRAYIEDPTSLPTGTVNKIFDTLKREHIDLLYLSFLSKYHGEDDAFGIVIDRDWRSHSIDQMNEVINNCKQKGYQYFLTNPCLEFWLLLHVADVATEYAEHLDKILYNEVDDHDNSYVSNLLHGLTGERKSMHIETFKRCYLPNIDSAIERAKGFASKDKLLEEIGSNLGELFELLRCE